MIGKPRNILPRLLNNVTRIIKYSTYKLDLVMYTFLLSPSPLSILNKKFYKKLDYPRYSITMKIESVDQLYRLYSCKKEPETIQWIEEFIKPDEVFYDIGANVGAYSLVCYAHAQGKIQIYSFEPGFTTYSALCENIIINAFNDKIIALPFVLSDQTKINKFYYSSISPGAASHSVGTDIVRHEDNIPASLNNSMNTYNYVVSYRLDDLISTFNLKKPNHVKIDVDGHELEVIKGCENLLNSPDLKTILIEIDKNSPGSDLIIEILKNKKFKIHKIFPHGNGILSNYIFIRS